MAPSIFRRRLARPGVDTGPESRYTLSRMAAARSWTPASPGGSGMIPRRQMASIIGRRRIASLVDRARRRPRYQHGSRCAGPEQKGEDRPPLPFPARESRRSAPRSVQPRISDCGRSFRSTLVERLGCALSARPVASAPDLEHGSRPARSMRSSPLEPASSSR